ncbi:Ppx/GppA phosphatase family protein [Coralliovum pocilloporae]|uniref:Ppx/GppA phosphatase family protein n=1 Tax=Coralliovum pocilloporae TaxID=3066369 RepID=UPI00330720D5
MVDSAEDPRTAGRPAVSSLRDGQKQAGHSDDRGRSGGGKPSKAGAKSGKKYRRRFKKNKPSPEHEDKNAAGQNKPATAKTEQRPAPARPSSAKADKDRKRPPRSPRSSHRRPDSRPADRYAALDLGTNNCRLLVAEPKGMSFRVVDAFSRIIRLGEGISRTGALNGAAMERAIEALKVCQDKLQDRKVRHFRLIATEACRRAANGEEFLERVRSEVGMTLEIVDRQTEARLAVAGCASLVHPKAEGALLFDIGGGSSEIVWLDSRRERERRSRTLSRSIRDWASLPVGVVTLSEWHGGEHVTRESFEAMVAEVITMLDANSFGGEALGRAIDRGGMHMLGTSGTVTTLAGIHLNLDRYDRRRVDGLWMRETDVDRMTQTLLDMSFEERVNNPCIGRDRADLVLAGCAILEAIRRKWRCERLRVADRGLREGILTELMDRNGVWRRPGRSQNGRQAKGRPRKRTKTNGEAT